MVGSEPWRTTLRGLAVPQPPQWSILYLWIHGRPRKTVSALASLWSSPGPPEWSQALFSEYHSTGTHLLHGIYFMAFPKQPHMCHEIKKWLGGQVDVLMAPRAGERHTRRRWPVQEEPGGQVSPALALQGLEDTSHTPGAECTRAGVPGL